MTKPQPWAMSLAWKGYWGGPYIKARSVNDGETSQDGEWYRRAEADKRFAVLEKQANCTHHHNGVSQFSPHMHVWKCDICGNIQDLEI